ncbi:unnamed protein product [Cuscuta europaea]|uniref:Glabrous enhancer-binding protein-like DBD domain-containing protein n=1 Tax=Cuscuta europaea TaxID=41803 RepID=A0A9P1EB95_CUSEU|nr:unnamed protein product [Cuscuta europaea]
MAPKIAPVDRPLPAASSDEDATSFATSDEDKQKSEQEEIIDQSESDYSSGGEHQVFKPNFGLEPQSSSESDDSSADSQEGEASPSASGFALLPREASKTTSTFCPNVTESPKQLSSRPSGKRALDVEEKDSQKKKSKPGEEVPLKEVKKSAANRLWSEDDQIAILKGKIDYEAQRGTTMPPISFYDFIKDKLNVSVSKSQITDKISRLKKNFLTLNEKGDVPTSDKPHESMVYELSEQIWGTSSNADSKSPGGTSDFAKPNAKNANGKVKRIAEENDISHSMKAAESEAVTEKKKKKIGHKDKESEKKKKQKTAAEEKDEQTPAVEKDKQTAGKGKHNHSVSKEEKESETDKKKKKKRKSAPEEKDEQIAVVEKHKQTAGKVEGSHSASKVKDSQTDEKKKKKKLKSAPEEKDEPTAVVEKDKHTAGKGKDKRSASKEKDNQTDEKRKKKKQKTAPDEKDEQTDAVEKCKQIADKGKDNHMASMEKQKQKRTANKDEDNHFAFVKKYNLAVAKVNDGNGDYIAKKKHNQVALKGAILGEVKNEEANFQYKYPYLFNSFNKENYPKTDQETLDSLKENVILIDSSKAAELEEKWTKLWEQKVESCRKLEDMLALQARFMLDAMKR